MILAVHDVEQKRLMQIIAPAFLSQSPDLSRIYGIATKWNLMATSSATILVSFQSPSPILKVRRLIGNVPSNTCVLPSFLSISGNCTSLLLPLIVNFPTTSYLVPAGAPALGLMLLRVKFAWGNWAALNHSFFSTSLLYSGSPRSKLAISISMLALAEVGLVPSKSICAANFLNFASTGTFICLNTAMTVLLLVSTFSGAASTADVMLKAAKPPAIAVVNVKRKVMKFPWKD